MQPRKILVIDGSKQIRSQHDAVLRRYSLIHAGSGTEALDALENHADIDLILLDVDTSRGGLQLLGRIKSAAAFKHIPVVILGSEGPEGQSLRYLEAGAANYIKKPFGNREFLEVIQQL